MRTALTRWSPNAGLFPSRFPRLFEETFGDFLTPLVSSEEVSNRAWLPPVDIREGTDSLTVVAELPGLTKKDIHISVENQILTLSGERKAEVEHKDETVHRLERSFGSFSRSFTLPQTVDTAKVKASFADGVLTIHLPKLAEAKPRQISID